jgi:hypothetical protein
MKFKTLKIVKICLTIKNKFLAIHFLYKNFILRPLFQSTQHFSTKKEGSVTGGGSGSVLENNGSGCGSGRPKNIRIHGKKQYY